MNERMKMFKALRGRNKINAIANNVGKDPNWYAVQVPLKGRDADVTL